MMLLMLFMPVYAFSLMPLFRHYFRHYDACRHDAILLMLIFF